MTLILTANQKKIMVIYNIIVFLCILFLIFFIFFHEESRKIAREFVDKQILL